jgi:hypothetical protein
MVREAIVILLAFSFLGNKLLCSVGGFVEEECVLPQDFEQNSEIVSIPETVLLALLFHILYHYDQHISGYLLRTSV